MAKPERFWSKRVPDEREGAWDAIVVGSGMGGMSTAALLSKLGMRVLVLEQHYVPGGFTHTFRRKGYTWDVGVHAVGEVTNKALPGRLLHALTDDRLEWASLGPVYDTFSWPDGLRIDFPDNPTDFRDNLLAAFPGEQQAIDGYLAEVRETTQAMRGYWLSRVLPRRLQRLGRSTLGRAAEQHLQRRTADVIAELTDNERLRAVFTAQWGYYGATPSTSSWAIQALVTHHFKWGGYYPVGGSAEIARELLRTVAQAGGWTRIVAPVDQILVEDRRATGVRMSDGDEIRAPVVVSAIGVHASIRRLLPPEVTEQDWAQEVVDLTPGPAHVCLYVGFKGDIRAAGAGSENQWFYDTYDMEWDAWDVGEGVTEPGRAMVLYCSFPSLKDPEHDPGPEQRHTGEVVTFVPWERWTKWSGTAWRKRGEDYLAVKKQIQQVLLDQFLEHMPALRPMVDHVELSTPLSTEYFVRPSRGSIYGLLPTPQRFRTRGLHPKSPVDGLYFSGSEVAGVGVVGAMMGGALCALNVRPLAGIRWARRHVWR